MGKRHPRKPQRRRSRPSQLGFIHAKIANKVTLLLCSLFLSLIPLFLFLESPSRMNTASIEARLRALEALLRESHNATATTTTTTDGPASRLRALETRLETLASTTTDGNNSGSGGGTTTLKQLWQESDALMRELDPGTALTHQQQIAAPILYRRQHVLASAESLHRDMGRVVEILTLLAVEQPQIIRDADTPVSEMQVTKAPLLTQTVPPCPPDQERLQKVERSLYETQQRVVDMATRMDGCVAAYHRLVSVVSEKMVLAQEDKGAAAAAEAKR